ncbi:MAG TPA: hypothetical protein ENI14_01140 [Thermoplasmatales archaeon]|nr:hypothetical protein [Thermoplasmatales archaeon]
MDMRDNPTAKFTLIIVALLLAGLIFGAIIANKTFSKIEKRIEEKYGRRVVEAVKQTYIFKTVIVAINIFLLLGLLALYISSFIKTSSNFMLGLSIFIGVLFIQSILSLPILHAALGAIPSFGLLGVLSNIFETIALVILFYLSME